MLRSSVSLPPPCPSPAARGRASALFSLPPSVGGRAGDGGSDTERCSSRLQPGSGLHPKILRLLIRVHEQRPHRPKLLEDAIPRRVLEVRHARRAACADLLSDEALDRSRVVVAPEDEALLELDEVFAELVGARELLGPGVDREGD